MARTTFVVALVLACVAISYSAPVSVVPVSVVPVKAPVNPVFMTVLNSNTSKATGSARVSINSTTAVATVELTIKNLNEFTQAHIHAVG